jgi:hypothetical protein
MNLRANFTRGSAWALMSYVRSVQIGKVFPLPFRSCLQFYLHGNLATNVLELFFDDESNLSELCDIVTLTFDLE